jgi:hypothetical protein
MANLSVSRADALAIRGFLLQWRDEGHANPLLPADVDRDGDGVVDCYGLDADDNVAMVRHVKLEDTVFVSDGEDLGPQQGVELGEPGPDEPPR